MGLPDPDPSEVPSAPVGRKPTISTLQITNVALNTSDETLEEIFADYGPIKRCFVVNPKHPGAKKTLGIVQFAFSDDAQKAFKDKGGVITIGNQKSSFKIVPNRPGKKDARIETEVPEIKEEITDRKTFKKIQEDIEYAKKKRARLIVRNLSFKSDEASLRQHFEQCGRVEDVNILKKKDGKMVGCGFVQFSSVAEASNAIKTLNGKPMLQRPIAVDWAVPKKEYEEQSGAKEVKKEEIEDQDQAELDEEEEDVQDEEDVDDDDDEPSEGDEEFDDEDEDMDQDDDDDEGSDEDRKGERRFGEPKPVWKTGHDVSENKTVFIRNINFDSDQDDLRELMEEHFGKVLFAVMVMDRMTDRPKGTAFVKFASAESAEKCMAASETDGIFLDGRQIYSNMALAKEDAEQKEKEKKTKEPKDSRNLFLSREGLVREGTQAAQGVSKADLEKRTQLEKYKRSMLKNLNMFVSPNRLCIRNIPPNIDDKKLVAVVKKFSENPTAKITEARVMKDLKNGGESKGYAFVAFETHEEALNALRKLNNNPKVFTKDGRPIVEFSIENRKVLNAREKRQQKSVEKNPLVKKTNVAKPPMVKPIKINKEAGTEDSSVSEKTEYMGTQSDPAIKKLPSHLGPKIRHKNPKITRRALNKQEKDKKNPKKNRKRISNEMAASQVSEAPQPKQAKKSEPKPKSDKKLKKIRQDRADEKKFNSLVSSYKARLMAGAGEKQKSKWFE